MMHQISIIPSHLIHRRHEPPPLRHILVLLLAKVRHHHNFLATGARGEDPAQHRALQQHHGPPRDQIERKQCLDPGPLLVKQCALERDHAEKRARVGRVCQILRPCLDQMVAGHNLDNVLKETAQVIRQRLKEKGDIELGAEIETLTVKKRPRTLSDQIRRRHASVPTTFMHACHTSRCASTVPRCMPHKVWQDVGGNHQESKLGSCQQGLDNPVLGGLVLELLLALLFLGHGYVLDSRAWRMLCGIKENVQFGSQFFLFLFFVAMCLCTCEVDQAWFNGREKRGSKQCAVINELKDIC